MYGGLSDKGSFHHKHKPFMSFANEIIIWQHNDKINDNEYKIDFIICLYVYIHIFDLVI